MFFRDLRMKSDVTLNVTLAEVRLPVRLGHRDANEVFGQPLARALAAASLGTVTEVRVHESAPDDVCGITLFLGLTNGSRESLATVGRMLDHLHAPLGSSIRLSNGGQPHVFGVAEGMELAIGDDRTPNAGARRDFAMACATAMKGFAISRGWTRRDGKTIFYFYGESFHRMQRTLESLMANEPVFQGAVARRMG